MTPTVCFVIWICCSRAPGDEFKEIHAVAETPETANMIAAEYGRANGYVRNEHPGGLAGVYELWGWKKPASFLGTSEARWVRIEEVSFFPAHALEKLARESED